MRFALAVFFSFPCIAQVPVCAGAVPFVPPGYVPAMSLWAAMDSTAIVRFTCWNLTPTINGLLPAGCLPPVDLSSLPPGVPVYFGLGVTGVLVVGNPPMLSDGTIPDLCAGNSNCAVGSTAGPGGYDIAVCTTGINVCSQMFFGVPTQPVVQLVGTTANTCTVTQTPGVVTVQCP